MGPPALRVLTESMLALGLVQLGLVWNTLSINIAVQEPPAETARRFIHVEPAGQQEAYRVPAGHALPGGSYTKVLPTDVPTSVPPTAALYQFTCPLPLPQPPVKVAV